MVLVLVLVQQSPPWTAARSAPAAPAPRRCAARSLSSCPCAHRRACTRAVPRPSPTTRAGPGHAGSHTALAICAPRGAYERRAARAEGHGGTRPDLAVVHVVPCVARAAHKAVVVARVGRVARMHQDAVKSVQRRLDRCTGRLRDHLRPQPLADTPRRAPTSALWRGQTIRAGCGVPPVPAARPIPTGRSGELGPARRWPARLPTCTVPGSGTRQTGRACLDASGTRSPRR